MNRLKRLFVFAVVLLLAAAFSGCGDRNGNNPPPPSSPIMSVVISPASANVQVGQTQQFNAQVSGIDNFSSAVNWSVNDVAGGNSTIGTILTSGLYKAPSSISNPVTVTVKAASVQDPTKFGTASVTINLPAPPSILGISPTLVAPGYENFTLTVMGQGFVPDSVVQVNGQNRITTFVSSTVLNATILASDVAQSGELSITVVTLGSVSNSVTLIVNVTASAGKVALLKIQSSISWFGRKVKNLGNVTGVAGQGDSAVGISSSLGVYVVFNPESRFGMFTSDQIGTVELPGFQISYSGTLTPGTTPDNTYFGLASAGDVDGDKINDILVYINVATSDPVNKECAGMVFLIKGGSYLVNRSVVDLADSSLPIVRMVGAAYNFAGQTLADGKDFNGDGMSDIAFSVPNFGFDPLINAGGSGAIYLIYGHPDFFNQRLIDLDQVGQQIDGVIITRDIGRTPISLASGLGSVGPGSDTVAFAGDLTGDGLPELLIGDPNAQNRSPNTQKVYVVFGSTGLRGKFFVEDIGGTFSGATYFTDGSMCQPPITFCGQNGVFGQTVGGRDGSVMLADPSAFLVVGASGMVFVSEQPLTNGQVVDIRLATQNLEASSLWSYLVDPSIGERIGFTLKDSPDFRMIMSPNFGIDVGRILFVPGLQLPPGNSDVATVARLTITGDNQNDLFGVGLDRLDGNGAIIASGFRKFYLIPKPIF